VALIRLFYRSIVHNTPGKPKQRMKRNPCLLLCPPVVLTCRPVVWYTARMRCAAWLRNRHLPWSPSINCHHYNIKRIQIYKLTGLNQYKHGTDASTTPHRFKIIPPQTAILKWIVILPPQQLYHQDFVNRDLFINAWCTMRRWYWT
jgi:hypothetical protein